MGLVGVLSRRQCLYVASLVLVLVLWYNLHTNTPTPQTRFRTTRNNKTVLVRPNNNTFNNSTKPLFQVLPTDLEYSGPANTPPFVLEQYKLVFFSTLKVGCTTWRHLFLKIMGYNVRNVHAASVTLVPHLNNYSVHEASAMFTDASWTRAIFLRDPLERFVSAYINKGLDKNLIVDKCCTVYHNDSFAACRRAVKTSAEQAFEIMKDCPNGHWLPQSHRIRRKYMQQINFVGRLETVQDDAQRLLRRIGAWEDFGQSGWGPNQTDAIFATRISPNDATTMTGEQKKAAFLGQHHATFASTKLKQHIPPTLYPKLLEYYREDYENPLFHFTIPDLGY